MSAFPRPRYYVNADGFPAGYRCDVESCGNIALTYHEACGHMACRDHLGPCSICKHALFVFCRACQVTDAATVEAK